MAEAAISSLVKLLGEQVIQKVKYLQGVEKQVQLLKEELGRMQSFLIDANKKQAEDERVRNWISEIRELAQDAEDTIEMFLINVANRGVLKCCTTFPKRMYHLDKIGDDIEKIHKRLEAINISRVTYGIKDLDEALESSRRANVESRRRLASWKKDEHLVGIEEHVKKLLGESILDEEKKGLSVAVLDGVGGIGKSTLAREIYNHPDVVARFDCRGWVVVSSEFTPQETLKQLILQLPGSDQQEIRRLEESTTDKLYIQENLREVLGKLIEGKSYFIVLDDVWEESHWEFLRDAFPNEQGKTSRLLITTRNKAMSKYCQYAHEMEKLDPEKSWELLLKKAFIDGKLCPQDLEKIGREILEKCNGLPLAISTIGGLLVGTQSKSRWEEVLKQINSLLGSAESTVSAILELSYLNLPPQLKSCFLCLAFFQEDATISTKDLIHIWISQCLIQQQEGRMLEETAKDYLDELINRNMVEVKDLTLDDRVNNCHLHDLIRDVCVRRAKEEIGFHVLKEKGISSKSLHKPRHSTVQYAVDLGDFLLNQSNHLRSLFLLDECSISSTRSPHRKSVQLLKILYFDSFHDCGTLPDSFRGLIGLKYLRIRSRFYRNLELPSWLGELEKLEVLDMENMVIELPQVPLKMKSLRYFSANTVLGLKRIDKWQNIETLYSIEQDDWICNSRLTDNCRLRELGIHMEGSEGLSRLLFMIGKFKNLVTLHLRITFAVNTLFDLSHLSNLTKLSLCGIMTKCPAASTFPPNISNLTMVFSELDEDPMLELGKLPKLEFLVLCGWHLGERIQVLHDGFPCLKAFTLGWMARLTDIDIEEGGMPQLRQLIIEEHSLLERQNLPDHIIVSVIKGILQSHVKYDLAFRKPLS